MEILGTEGVILFDDDHKDQVLYTELGHLPWLRSRPQGEYGFLEQHLRQETGPWAISGDLLASETRAWLDHLCTGRPCVLATPEEARRTLEVTLAIERAMRTKKVVDLPLEKNG